MVPMIDWLLKGVSLLLGAALLPSTLEILLLTLAGLFRPRSPKPASFDRPYCLAILIPAHNEELSIERCLASISRADATGVKLQIVVIADNCTDQTAKRAAAAGAMVLNRQDHTRRGKGYALHHAFLHLTGEGFDGFAVVDADSEVSPNLIVETVRFLHSGADATQCRYLIRNAGATPRLRLLRLGMGAFNVLRARGRATLGFSAGLYGNGFALSAATVTAVPYVAFSIVEDLEYHLMLLEANRRVKFIDAATVWADPPGSRPGIDRQRARWEGGRLRVARARLPRLLKRLSHGEFRFWDAFVDLLLLPLAFQVALLLLLLISPFAVIRGVGVAGLAIVSLHLSAAAFVAGDGWRDLLALLSSPAYLAWKLRLIPKLLQSASRNAAWNRTERSSERAAPGAELIRP